MGKFFKICSGLYLFFAIIIMIVDIQTNYAAGLNLAIYWSTSSVRVLSLYGIGHIINQIDMINVRLSKSEKASKKK